MFSYQKDKLAKPADRTKSNALWEIRGHGIEKDFNFFFDPTVISVSLPEGRAGNTYEHFRALNFFISVCNNK
jgi:hypothetical protein